LIIKTRSIQILAKLSDFESINKNYQLQSNLITGLLQVFGSN